MTELRVGLFGGTFDPPHFGHVAALRAAARTGRYERLEVTVAGDPYHKRGESPVRPAALRLAMAHAAFDDLDLVHVSDREIRREGPSYTVVTVEELLAGASTVDLIIGADLLAQLDTWFDAARLRDLVEVGVVPRPGASAMAPAGWRCYEIAMEPVDLSSTFVRSLVPGREALDEYLPAPVIPLFEGARG